MTPIYMAPERGLARSRAAPATPGLHSARILPPLSQNIAKHRQSQGPATPATAANIGRARRLTDHGNIYPRPSAHLARQVFSAPSAPTLPTAPLPTLSTAPAGTGPLPPAACRPEPGTPARHMLARNSVPEPPVAVPPRQVFAAAPVKLRRLRPPRRGDTVILLARREKPVRDSGDGGRRTGIPFR